MSDNTTNSAPADVQESPVAQENQEQASEAIEQSTEKLAEGQEVSAEKTEKTASEKKEEAKLAKKLKKLKIKVDSKEFEEDLPFEIEEGSDAEKYMRQQLQLAKVAQKRMSEHSDLKKKLDQVSDYLQGAKGNPKKVRELMKELDIDEKQLAAMIVEEELERQKKSPEQLAKEQLEQELQKMKEERDKEKAELEQQKHDLMVRQYQEKYQQGFERGLQKAGLPDNKFIRNSVINYMQEAIDKGYDIEIEDVVPLVKQDWNDALKHMFSAAPEDFIEELLGKDNLKRLRKRNLEKAKEAPPVPLSKQVVDTGDKAPKKREESKLSFKDYFKKL